MNKNEITQTKAAPLATAEQVADMFGGETGIQIPVDAPLPQVQILRETPQFELPDGETVKGLLGHILHWHNANQYYDHPFGEGDGNGIPKCVSSNAIEPDGGREPEPGPCRKCPYNQFGSAMGTDGQPSRAKACQNTIRLYLLLEDDVLPCVLKAPPSSLGKKESLMKFLTILPNVSTRAGFGNKYQPIKVRFKLHRKDFDSGMSASVLDVEVARALDLTDEADLAKLDQLGRLYQDFMQNYIGRISEDVAGERMTEQDEIPI